MFRPATFAPCNPTARSARGGSLCECAPAASSRPWPPHEPVRHHLLPLTLLHIDVLEFEKIHLNFSYKGCLGDGSPRKSGDTRMYASHAQKVWVCEAQTSRSRDAARTGIPIDTTLDYCYNRPVEEPTAEKISAVVINILIANRNNIADYYNGQTPQTREYLAGIFMRYNSTAVSPTLNRPGQSEIIFSNWQRPVNLTRSCIRSGIDQMFRRYKPIRGNH